MKLELDKKKTQLEEDEDRTDGLFELPVEKQLPHSEIPPFHFHAPTAGFHSYPEAAAKFQNHFSTFSFVPQQPLGVFPTYPSPYSQDITSKELGGTSYKNILCEGFGGEAFPGYASLREGIKEHVSLFLILKIKIDFYFIEHGTHDFKHLHQFSDRLFTKQPIGAFL